MNLGSRYRLSLSAISLVVCPLLVSIGTLPEVVFGAEAQEGRSGLVAQTTTATKAEEDRILKSCRDNLTSQKNQEALLSCQIAVKEFRVSNNLNGESKALGNLGNAYYALGKYDKAIEFQLQRLAIAREIKNRRGEGQSLGSLGNAYDALGKYDKAIESQLQSLAIAREIKDRLGEGYALGNLGVAYASLGKYDKAIEFQLQRLAIAREIKDRLGEGQSLGNLGYAYYALDKYDKVIEYQLQSLEIAREIKDRSGEGNALGSLGNAYFSLGKYDKAIEFQLQSLEIAREIKDRSGEGTALGSLGVAYNALAKYDKAIEFQLQSLAIAREIKDRRSEGNALGNLGNAYIALAKYDKVIEFYLQALLILREINDRNGEGTSLGNLGSAYHALGKYDKAIEFYLQDLAIAREIKNRRGEGTTLGNLGTAYNSLGKYDKAIEFHLQSLAITREIKDRRGEGNALENLGSSYNALGKYDKAIEYQLQRLEIAREIKDRNGEGNALGNLGNAYFNLDKYDKVIEFYLQSLGIAREIKDRSGEVVVLGNLGIAYDALGKYDKAIEFQQQTLAIAREIKDRSGEGNALGNLGNAYFNLGKYDKAIELNLQRLEIAREIKDRRGEGTTLGSLGSAYGALGKYDKAIELHLQYLEITREIKNRLGEVYALNNLAAAYGELNRDREAMISYQQALTIAREISYRSGEGEALANLGNVLSRGNQPELAILFYKQSINVREAIRKDVSKLDKDIQKSYLKTVEKTYRNLADLLLKQDRILEAQQVLDLLKVEELSDYLRTVRGNAQTSQGVELQRPEQNIIALAGELNSLQQSDRDGKLTEPDRQRLTQLVQTEKEQNKQFNAFLESSEVKKLIVELRRVEEDQNVNLNSYRKLQKDVFAQTPNAVLLYPLILEDRLELILLNAKTPPIRRTVKIKREELNQLIVDFRSALLDSGSEDVKEPAQKLYKSQISPFESELKQLEIDTIIYAPDGQLRYIPLAALHDGKQWLVEKYKVNNITAESLTSFNAKPIAKPRILAGAFGGKAGESRFGQSGLPATITEVQKIASRFPDTTSLTEAAFTKTVTESGAKSHTILHLATHGELSISNPQDSFILFGNGDKATISEIKEWTLNNIDLVILSACQTGVGAKLGTGVEILGLGYQMQAAGARVSIASLWKVDDAGTQALMDAFYDELKKGDVAIAESLRRAQVALIKSPKYNHPNYWSAFFAIGNGL